MTRPMLAAAGILFILLVVAGTIYLIFRLVKSGHSDAASGAVTDDERQFAELRARYDVLFIKHGVPNNAMIVRLACNNYEPGGASSRHYCWIKEGAMMLFPLWESLVGAKGKLVARDIQLREWNIPVADIVCFATEQGLPNKFVVLQFKKENDVISLAFSEDAARVFSILFPEKDFSHLLEELYPKSSRNIRDIKESFLSLKELRGEDLITEDEYNAKKKEMLILM